MHPYGYDALPLDDAETEFSAKSGKSLEPGSKVVEENYVIEAMRTVYDPEIPVIN